MEPASEAWGDGDVVCFGVIPTGQTVDWQPGSCEPSPVEWVPEEVFMHILDVSAQLRVPVLRKLDPYVQTRVTPADCKRILAKWGEIEATLEGGPSQAAAAAMQGVLRNCVDNPEKVELLIEGP